MKPAPLYALSDFASGPDDKPWQEYTSAALETWDDEGLAQLAGFAADELVRRALLDGRIH
jgi:hypothetical protein